MGGMDELCGVVYVYRAKACLLLVRGRRILGERSRRCSKVRLGESRDHGEVAASMAAMR